MGNNIIRMSVIGLQKRIWETLFWLIFWCYAGILVPPGRYVRVDVGEGSIVAITKFNFANNNRPDNEMQYADLRSPRCEVYVGIKVHRPSSWLALSTPSSGRSFTYLFPYSSRSHSHLGIPATQLWKHHTHKTLTKEEVKACSPSSMSQI